MSPDSTSPEYSPEQVEASVERVLRQMVNGPLPDEDTATVVVDSESFLNLHSDIRTILSALAKAEDARAEWERTANAFADDVCGYINEILALRSRLESAERDTARLDWMLEHGARLDYEDASGKCNLTWEFGGFSYGHSRREAVDAGMAKTAEFCREHGITPHD